MKTRFLLALSLLATPLRAQPPEPRKPPKPAAPPLTLEEANKAGLPAVATVSFRPLVTHLTDGATPAQGKLPRVQPISNQCCDCGSSQAGYFCESVRVATALLKMLLVCSLFAHSLLLSLLTFSASAACSTET